MTTQPSATSVGLHTDFHDYYDHQFAASWQRPERVFERVSTQGMDRKEMLAYMSSLGLTTPRYGTVAHLVPHLREAYGVAEPFAEIVVYLDPRTHAGEGKVKVTLDEALAQYPEHLASEHIANTPTGLGRTLRYLRIGKRQFWLRYTSLDDWRSNCGEVEIEVLCEKKSRSQDEGVAIPYPLFAVDFVHAGNLLYAIDFNTAPGLRGTGLEKLISAREVYEEIAGAVRGGK